MRSTGTPWVAIALGLLAMAVIYLLAGLATGRHLAEDWEDLAIPILAASSAAALFGWRVGVRRSEEARAEAESDAQALRERIVELELELERLRDGPGA